MPTALLEPTISLDQERLQTLKQLIPEAFADGKINWDVLKEMLGEHLEDEGRDAEHFGLFWPGKRAARRLASTPSKGTLAPAPGEGIDEKTTENIFIEGDNSEVLKLLQKSYAGRVKMIYIDPPYNTGNDLIYKDNFEEPLEDYLKKIGRTDEEGKHLTTNTKADGRFHSNWLNMMYSRLRLARQLLCEDGVLFVSINDEEVSHLRLLLDEIFGEECFIGSFIWKSRHNVDSRDKTGISTDHEYALCYGHKIQGKEKDLEKYSNPDDDPRGPWMSDNLVGLATKDKRPNLHYDLINPETGINYGCPEKGWRYEKATMNKKIAEGRILWPANPKGRPRHKKFLNELQSAYTGLSTILNVPNTSAGTQEVRGLFEAELFDFPKPVGLLKALIAQGAQKDDIILDFFAGSCTTAQAVLEINCEDGGNRKFICVQLPEKFDPGKPAFRAGYSTIADLSKERIRRAIKKLKKERTGHLNYNGHKLDLGFKVFKLQKSNFKAWQDFYGEDIEQLHSLFSTFETPLVDGWKEPDVLTEIMLKQGFPLSATVSPAAEFTKNKMFSVESSFCDHRLYVSLDDKIKEETIRQAVRLPEKDLFICLDSALTDKAKLQLSDACKLETI
jgi:adenine-specific DNA-methyltransferase